MTFATWIRGLYDNVGTVEAAELGAGVTTQGGKWHSACGARSVEGWSTTVTVWPRPAA